MKTITKTFALLVATLSFAACTQQTIEPARPVYDHPLPTVIQIDTTKQEPLRFKLKSDDQPLFIEAVVAVGCGTPTTPVANPPLEEVTIPRRPMKPVALTDSLAY